MKVLAGYTGEETWTEQEEKQVRRKIDLRLMPVLCITYGLQYYDKAMLSQAVRMIVIFNTLLWLTIKRNCLVYAQICISLGATVTPFPQLYSTLGKSRSSYGILISS